MHALAHPLSSLHNAAASTPGQPSLHVRRVQPTRSKTNKRVADGSITMEEAQRRNAEHYKRFFGKPKPKSMFF